MVSYRRRRYSYRPRRYRRYRRKTYRRRYRKLKTKYRIKRKFQKEVARCNPYIGGPQPIIIPNSMFRRCTYAILLILLLPLRTTLALYSFRANSIFDPDSSGVGTTAACYSDLSAKYNNYIVHSSKIRWHVSVSQAGADLGPLVMCTCLDDDATTFLATGSWATQMSDPRCKRPSALLGMLRRRLVLALLPVGITLRSSSWMSTMKFMVLGSVIIRPYRLSTLCACTLLTV